MSMATWLAHGHLRAWWSLTCTATHARTLDIIGHTLTTSRIDEKVEVISYAPGLCTELMRCV
jgi:hypothetical protein